MKAMILAAGFGTRLWPLTEDRTKPAVPFLGKPLVAYSVEYVRRFGIRDIVVNLHHMPESVRAALGDGSAYDVRITYSHEEEILGTGGAIDRVRSEFEGDEFVVVNGKIVTDIDLAAAIAEHRERDAIATLVLLRNTKRERFSIVATDETGAISSFEGHPDTDAEGGEPPLMFTGIQVLSPRILDYIPRDRFSHTTTDAYPAAMRAGELVLGHVADGDWRELSTLERYLDLSVQGLRNRGLRYIAGDGSTVHDRADVADAVLWRDAHVGEGAYVRRAVLADGVRLGAGDRIEDAVVVRREIVGEIERGSVQGEHLVVPVERVLD